MTAPHPLHDITVDVDTRHSAQIESWLLGHGRLPEPVAGAPSGRARYHVKQATRFEIDELRGLGALITRGDTAPRSEGESIVRKAGE